ncbi:MAG: hypothetical protein ACYC1D_14460 [Acidimicrobiales bacterium]
MVTFKADLDAMRGLSTQFASVHRMLSECHAGVGAVDGTLGSGDLEGEVASFVSGWRDGRTKICNGIQGLANRLDAAVGAYGKAEHQIEAAVHRAEKR